LISRPITTNKLIRSNFSRFARMTSLIDALAGGVPSDLPIPSDSIPRWTEDTRTTNRFSRYWPGCARHRVGAFPRIDVGGRGVLAIVAGQRAATRPGGD